MKQYYYLTDANEQMGPLSEQDLLQYINSETLVFCEGLSNWTAAKDVDSLRQYFDFAAEDSENAEIYDDIPAEQPAASHCTPVPAVPENVPDMPGEYEPATPDLDATVSKMLWYVGLAVFVLWVLYYALKRIAESIH